MNVKTQRIAPAFQLKGSVLTLSVLQLLTLDYSLIKQQLEQIIQKNPNFFNRMPIVIDMQKLFTVDNDINFEEINSLLRDNGLVPVGIANANPKQLAAAKAIGMGILPNMKTNQIPKVNKTIERSKIILQPVRSGQQVYAKNSDLIVLASVSNGAEILADGNIHIYGTLRGRAIAGAEGDVSSRIFCQKLEAELIAIAGHYKLQEEISSSHCSEQVQVYLDDNQLVIATLN
jgi:septum site-determining protein MinC